jgi:SAM-dependent methyltransferase
LKRKPSFRTSDRRFLNLWRQRALYWETRIFLTALKLDLFTFVSGTEKTAGFLARKLRLDPRAVEILMDGLASLGFLAKRGKHYTNAGWVDRVLSRRSKSYSAEALLVQEDAWKLWGELDETIRTGRPRAKEALFLADPARTSHLLWALHRDAERIAPGLARKAKLGNGGTLLDLGGGSGTYALAFLRRYPRMHAVIYDLPQALKVARAVVRASGLARRVRFQEGNFLIEPICGVYDVALVSDVLHGHSEKENRAVLEKVRSCLKPRGVLFVRDVFLSEDRTRPRWGALFSVNLLLFSDKGRCYTKREVVSWLRQAGFKGIHDIGPSSRDPFDPNRILRAETGSEPR